MFTLLVMFVVCFDGFVVFILVAFEYFRFDFGCLRILIVLMLDLYLFGFGLIDWMWIGLMLVWYDDCIRWFNVSLGF